MKKLNDQRLQAGDIILTSGPNKTSRVVRKATRSDISHAMIYVQHCSVIDATADGVHSGNIQRMFLDDDCVVVALRTRKPLSREAILKITDYARAATGTEYSFPEAVATVTRKLRAKSRKQFCSRLAAQAYAFAGIGLVVDPDYCTPEELRKSDLLFEVADVELPATSKEMAFWESRTDVPRLMADATNAVLKATRRKSPEIQSLNDINDYLLSHPEDDHYFRKAYERSGYLSIWQVEYEKSRWQYDLDRMTRIADAVPDSRAEIESYCKETVAGAADGRRYDINHQGYLDLATVTELTTFRMLTELYGHLAKLHRLRVETARGWLSGTN